MPSEELPTGWVRKTLGDLGRIVTGKTPSTSIPEYFGGEIPFVTPSDMDGRKFIATTERNLTVLGAEAVKGSRIPAGAIMVSCIGSDMGKVAVATRDCVTNQQINSLVVSGEVSPNFVYHDLAARRYELRSLAASGSAQPILNKGDFSRLSITLPPPQEQRSIARVLDALDDKIHLNRRTNHTLEDIARALFAHHFPYDHSDDLPSGWRSGGVETVATMSRGTVNPAESRDEEFDHYSIPAFDQAQMPATDLGAAILSNKWSVPNGVVLVSKLNPRIPRVWFPRLSTTRRSICSTEFFPLLPRPGFTAEYLYCLCTSPAFTDEFATLTTGTSGSHQRVRPDFMTTMEITVAPLQVIEQFTAKVRPLLDQVKSNREESRTLAALRDALLPKVLSGEIRVPQAAKLVEATT